ALAVEARAAHLQHWSEARPDWMKQFAEAALPAGECVLDEFSGGLRSQLTFAVKKGGSYTNGEWISGNTVALKVAGTQRGGVGVGLYRQTLLERGIYDVVSSGPDMPDRFALELTTPRLAPKFDPDAAKVAPPAVDQKGEAK
ncbi:MAG: hypothetical protein ACOYN0_11405, partial [Phycisphaerales bacterium]